MGKWDRPPCIMNCGNNTSHKSGMCERCREERCKVEGCGKYRAPGEKVCVKHIGYFRKNGSKRCLITLAQHASLGEDFK